MTPAETPPGVRLNLTLTPLLLVGVVVVIVLVGALYVVWNDSGDSNSGVPQLAGGTVYPTPAPVTFVVPTPIPPTPAPTFTPFSQQVLDQPVPEFTLPLLDGGAVTLPDLTGEIVLLNFWATWCEPCREEMPLLQTLHDSGAVQVIAVTDPTDGQTEDAIRDFMAQYNLTLPVALTSEIAVYTTFEVAQIPTTYFIDRAGIVRFVHIGALHDHDADDYLAQLRD